MTSFVHSKSGAPTPHKKSLDIPGSPVNPKLPSLPISKTNIKIENVEVLQSDQSIDDAFKIISETLTAPVFDKEKNQFTGIIDLQNFLGFILYKLPMPPTGVEMKSNLGEIEKFPYMVLDKNATVSQLLKYFNTGVHTAFILNEMKKLEMISQLSIAKWIKDNIQEFGDLGDKPIGELLTTIPAKSLISIKNTQPVYEALKVLYSERIYGMAIVDDANKVVGNISIIDIKYASNYLDKLSLPLKDFFKQRPIYTCSSDSTLLEVLNQFIDKGIHRLHIVANNQPIDVGDHFVPAHISFTPHDENFISLSLFILSTHPPPPTICSTRSPTITTSSQMYHPPLPSSSSEQLLTHGVSWE
eukprot:gene7853-9215_t